MPVTLSYGYIKPITGDTGATFWSNLEADITQLNSHSHNGIDSAILSSTSITPVADTTSIVAVNWVLVSLGTYRMAVTTPPSISFDSYGLSFQITNGTDVGARVFPTVVKISATSYYVYTNDNTVNMTVLYMV